MATANHASSIMNKPQPSCGSFSSQGFFCCSKTNGNRYVANRDTCCATEPIIYADPKSCPDLFPATARSPIQALIQGIAGSGGQGAGVGAGDPKNAQGQCTNLSPQDQDCCNYGGIGGAADSICVAGKSAIKGTQAGLNLPSTPGCNILTPIPVIGQMPCYQVVIAGFGVVVGLFLLMKLR